MKSPQRSLKFVRWSWRESFSSGWLVVTNAWWTRGGSGALASVEIGTGEVVLWERIWLGSQSYHSTTGRWLQSQLETLQRGICEWNPSSRLDTGTKLPKRLIVDWQRLLHTGMMKTSLALAIEDCYDATSLVFLKWLDNRNFFNPQKWPFLCPSMFPDWICRQKADASRPGPVVEGATFQATILLDLHSGKGWKNTHKEWKNKQRIKHIFQSWTKHPLDGQTSYSHTNQNNQELASRTSPYQTSVVCHPIYLKTNPLPFWSE